jgi:hypothetical protein
MQKGLENVDLVDYIERQIAHMKSCLTLGTKREISFFELEEALKDYPHIYISLISMETLAKLEYQKANEEFNSWFGSNYLTERSLVNRPELTAQKWAGQKEIEYMVKATHSTEYLERKNSLLELEHKHEFVKDLVEMWKSYQFILSALSSNVRAEAGMTPASL